MIQAGVAALVKDSPIHCGWRLVLDHPGGSVSIKPTSVDHWYLICIENNRIAEMFW